MAKELFHILASWKDCLNHVVVVRKWILLILLFPAMLQAAEVVQSVVDYRNGRFSAHSEVLIQLPVSRVRAILTRYEELPQVNGGIKSVKIVWRRQSGQVRLQVQAAGCVLFICKSFQWVQEAETLP